MPRLLRVIPDISMGCRHVGLVKQMKSHGVEFAKLKQGDVIALLNRAQNILCVMAVLPEADSFGFLGQYKSPHGRVPLEAIEFITASMGGGGFDMNKATKMGLEKLLGRKTREAAAT